MFASPSSTHLRHTVPWLATIGLAWSLSQPGCAVGYLAQQGYFQAELLVGRQPAEQVLQQRILTDAEAQKLRLIPRIKTFGARIGLSATDNYDTINPDWKRTIWNVSACEPLAFSPRAWWFPIVGSVPYLGYFRESDARARAEGLREQGFDVHVRTAGAYSTLGWFRDPILRPMLAWDEPALAETVLHELAHATLWIRGSVQFNESFANFVGEQAALRYLAETYGDGAAVMREFTEKKADSEAIRGLLHQVYVELDAVYKNADLSDTEKLADKQRILASIPDRAAALDLHRKEAILQGLRRGDWNNARLMQFRTYHRSPEWFAALLDAEQGDLQGFIRRIDVITRDADDPYTALERAVR
jgi:predicted aminopeptidase